MLKWFQADTERHVQAARRLRASFQEGTLVVFAPPLLYIEILNVAGRRWHWEHSALVELAYSLESLAFDLREPHLGNIAEWIGAGLTAYDATYVAIAQADAIPLVTDHARILSVAPTIARSLADL